LAVEADERKRLDARRLRGSLLLAGLRRRQRGFDRAAVPAADATADEHALERGQLRECDRRLQGSREAEPDALVGRLVGKVALAEQDAPCVGPLGAGEQAQRSRLAGAVRANERRRLATRELEREAVERDDPSERLPEPFGA